MTLTAAATTLMSQEEAIALVESVIAQSQADDVFVSLEASESALSRFSENQISQNIAKNRFTLTVTSAFDQKSASASTTELDPEAITQTIRRSEELAKYAPEDPEWVPLLEPQTYEARQPAFDDATAQLSPLARGEIVQRACKLCEKAGVEASGTLSSSASLRAIGNSLGLRGSDRRTEADFSLTARTDTSSSWSNRSAWNIEQIPFTAMTEQVIQKAIKAQNPRELKPGVYPVIFEPAALATLLQWLVWNLDARAADEGRSFMARVDDQGQVCGNRIGEQLFSPLVDIQRDPAHPLLQTGTFFSNGLPNSSLAIATKGIPQTLSYSRYWAQEQQVTPNGMFAPIVMGGADQSLPELIANTERGIFVSRSWYVRYVNPRTLEVTGMTRDGTFWVEDGEIKYPIKNLRFNQRLPEMLAQVDALSDIVRIGSCVVPGVRVKAFNFTSVTDSI